jgi:hypothetical protein
MGLSVRLADLDAMTVEERDEVLGRLVREAMGPENGQLALVDARVKVFERRYEMSSAELLERLRVGTQSETAEIAQWLFWLAVQKRCARK